MPHDETGAPIVWPRGFTTMELLIAVAIVATLSAIVVPLYAEAQYRARVSQAMADIQGIASRVKVWEIFNRRLPDSLAEADIAGFVDPWGNPYQYLRIDGGANGKGAVRKDRKLNPINSDFDLYSMGRDRVTELQISNKDSLDDIIRANDGSFVGLASEY